MAAGGTFEALEALAKVEDLDILVELGIALNQLRVRGGVLSAFEELPQSINTVKEAIGLKII